MKENEYDYLESEIKEAQTVQDLCYVLLALLRAIGYDREDVE